MARASREVQLVEYPRGEVRPAHFRIATVEVPEPGPGEVLVRNTFTSVDPGMRLRLAEQGPAGYFEPFPLGARAGRHHDRGRGHRVPRRRLHARRQRVARRRLAGVRRGAGRRCPHSRGLGTLHRTRHDVAPAQAYLGPLGGMGLTAYAGLIDAAGLRAGDVVWVSAAAGAVGSLAVQIAKLRGHRVIGSAGSHEKVRYLLDELGLDAAFNYRDGSIVEQLRAAAPDGIDVYFDNVGGDHLEAALATLRRGGRVALCGAVSQYESSAPGSGPSNLFQAVSNELTLRGFRGSSHLHRFADVRREIGGWLRADRLRYRETIVDGLERAPEALVRMLAGNTTGKTLVRSFPK